MGQESGSSLADSFGLASLQFVINVPTGAAVSSEGLTGGGSVSMPTYEFLAGSCSLQVWE